MRWIAVPVVAAVLYFAGGLALQALATEGLVPQTSIPIAIVVVGSLAAFAACFVASWIAPRFNVIVAVVTAIALTVMNAVQMGSSVNHSGLSPVGVIVVPQLIAASVAVLGILLKERSKSATQPHRLQG